ncbi:MAG: hypothetical protein JST92_16800 [Deltaproteobacteria bacterium]|nr:hypothetical protein [Deltaproteobacteria bacterium]
MNNALSAQDFVDLVAKLTPDERVRLARMALDSAAAERAAGEAYESQPPKPGEFDGDEDPLSWDAEGWS